MKVLFATKNPAKINNYKKILEENAIEVITIKDLNEKIDVNENGKDALENAFIKAKTYYDLTKITTIAIDDNLFIENLPENLQPGTHVRRINGKELTDEEMIEYYSNLAKDHGGKLIAKWVYGIVIYDGVSKKEFKYSNPVFYLVDKPSENRNIGYPLDSLAIIPEKNKYLVDFTLEEKIQRNKTTNNVNAINFILENLN